MLFTHTRTPQALPPCRPVTHDAPRLARVALPSWQAETEHELRSTKAEVRTISVKNKLKHRVKKRLPHPPPDTSNTCA